MAAAMTKTALSRAERPPARKTKRAALFRAGLLFGPALAGLLCLIALQAATARAGAANALFVACGEYPKAPTLASVFPASKRLACSVVSP